jgi:hypothetical protein
MSLARHNRQQHRRKPQRQPDQPNRRLLAGRTVGLGQLGHGGTHAIFEAYRISDKSRTPTLLWGATRGGRGCVSEIAAAPHAASQRQPQRRCSELSLLRMWEGRASALPKAQTKQGTRSAVRARSVPAMPAIRAWAPRRRRGAIWAWAPRRRRAAIWAWAPGRRPAAISAWAPGRRRAAAKALSSSNGLTVRSPVVS